MFSDEQNHELSRTKTITLAEQHATPCDVRFACLYDKRIVLQLNVIKSKKIQGNNASQNMSIK